MAYEIGKRVRELRQDAALSQADLARVLDVTTPQISRAEAGTRQLSGFELGLLSEAFGWDVRDMLGLPRARAKLAVAARLRSADGSATDALKRAGDFVEADALLDDLGLTEQSRGLAVFCPQPAPRNEREALEQGTAAAQTVRDKLAVNGALTDLIGFAEDALGVDVAVAPLEQGCDGVIAVAEDIALAVIDSQIMSGRQRFTLAHEIAHGVLGDVTDDVLVDRGADASAEAALGERRAHAFASALLMPEPELRHVLGEAPGVVQFVEAMTQFGVSWSALKYRCGVLGVELSPALAEMPGDKVFAEAGRTGDAERLSVPIEPRVPSRLVRRVRDAYADALIGERFVAATLGVEDDELAVVLGSIESRFEVPPPVTLSRANS